MQDLVKGVCWFNEHIPPYLKMLGSASAKSMWLPSCVKSLILFNMIPVCLLVVTEKPDGLVSVLSLHNIISNKITHIYFYLDFTAHSMFTCISNCLPRGGRRENSAPGYRWLSLKTNMYIDLQILLITQLLELEMEKSSYNRALTVTLSSHCKRRE